MKSQAPRLSRPVSEAAFENRRNGKRDPVVERVRDDLDPDRQTSVLADRDDHDGKSGDAVRVGEIEDVVALEWHIGTWRAAVQRGGPDGDGREDDIVGRQKPAHDGTEGRPASEQGEVARRVQVLALQHVEQCPHLVGVRSLRRGKVLPRARPTVGSHHRKEDRRRRGDVRWHGLLDPAPVGFESTGCRDDGVTRGRPGARHTVVEVVPDLKGRRRGVRLGEQRRTDERVDSVGAGEHGKQKPEILDVARHRPDRAHVDHAGVAG